MNTEVFVVKLGIDRYVEAIFKQWVQGVGGGGVAREKGIMERDMKILCLLRKKTDTKLRGS